MQLSFIDSVGLSDCCDSLIPILLSKVIFDLETHLKGLVLNQIAKVETLNTIGPVWFVPAQIDFIILIVSLF